MTQKGACELVRNPLMPGSRWSRPRTPALRSTRKQGQGCPNLWPQIRKQIEDCQVTHESKTKETKEFQGNTFYQSADLALLCARSSSLRESFGDSLLVAMFLIQTGPYKNGAVF